MLARCGLLGWRTAASELERQVAHKAAQCTRLSSAARGAGVASAPSVLRSRALFTTLLLACSLCTSGAPSDSSSDEEVPYMLGGYEDPYVSRNALDWSLSKADYEALKPRDNSLQMSRIAIDEQAPNFSGDAVINGDITELKASDYKGKWTLLFFYPKDFTFVCPTEIIAFSDRVQEFTQRNCNVIGASTDSAEVHLAWIRTPRKKGGLGRMQIPLLADVDRRISAAYGVLGKANFPNRGIYLLDPNGVLKSMQILNNSVGRSVDEALRLLDAFQYVEEHGVVCPANWQPGDDTMEADPDGSQKYFASAASSQEEGDDFGQTLTAIKSKNDFEHAIRSSKPVVVDFMAGWCGKCRQIAPTVEALQTKHSGVEFYKFDTSDDALSDLAGELGVSALPVFRFYKNGKEARAEVQGYKKKPLQDAVEELAQRA